ncbi:MAG: hypothetical protein FWC32_05125 [Firmicutes bacterium]|nr:hypothetical protein [Bacillota bacterium]
MEKELFDDLMEGLNDALVYAKGDKTKARSMVVEIPDNESCQMLYRKIEKLPELKRQQVAEYVDELLRASVG